MPGKSHGWRSIVGYSPWGRKESNTTEQLHFTFYNASSGLLTWQNRSFYTCINTSLQFQDDYSLYILKTRSGVWLPVKMNRPWQDTPTVYMLAIKSLYGSGSWLLPANGISPLILTLFLSLTFLYSSAAPLPHVSFLLGWSQHLTRKP